MSERDAVVRTVGLGKSYGGRPALIDVDLRIERGEVFAYLGPNGAGKTTTLRVLMGFLRPNAGRASIFGLDAWREAAAVHRRVGYVPGEPALYGRMSGRELFAYLGHLRGGFDERHATDLCRTLDVDPGQPVQRLSKGNRQKIALVQALMSRPELLILDEPTTGLDPLAQQAVHELLRGHAAGGGTVLLSSHLLAEVQQIADRVAIIRAGRLVAVERLEELRRKSLHSVRASLAHPVDPARLTRIPGVRDVRVTGAELSCSAPQSALDALVRELSGHGVVDLSCEEASLEETFLAYYGQEKVRSAA